MNKVFAVQELKRYHCPECDGSYIKRDHDGFRCQTDSCGALFKAGVPKPMHSLTEAAAYGDIEVILPMNNIGIAMQPIVATMKHKLKDFDDTDFLLPVGDPVAIGIAATIAARANAGRVNFLRWDRQTRSYIKIGVTI